jgi:hypothetical protein
MRTINIMGGQFLKEETKLKIKVLLVILTIIPLALIR